MKADEIIVLLRSDAEDLSQKILGNLPINHHEDSGFAPHVSFLIHLTVNGNETQSMIATEILREMICHGEEHPIAEHAGILVNSLEALNAYNFNGTYVLEGLAMNDFVYHALTELMPQISRLVSHGEIFEHYNASAARSQKRRAFKETAITPDPV